MKNLKFSFILLLTVLLQINSYSQEFITRKSGFDKDLETKGLLKQPGKPEIETYKYTEGKDKYEIKVEFTKYKKGGDAFEATTISVFKNGILESSESTVENSQGNSVASTFAKSASCDFANCIKSAINSDKGACKDAKSCASKSKQISNKKDRRKFFLQNCSGYCIRCGVKWFKVLGCVLDCI